MQTERRGTFEALYVLLCEGRRGTPRGGYLAEREPARKPATTHPMPPSSVQPRYLGGYDGAEIISWKEEDDKERGRTVRVMERGSEEKGGLSRKGET